MSNDYFRLKNFEVKHGRCAMKVGTDGVLIGSWCRVPSSQDNDMKINVLDIGTGSGIVAFCVADRYREALVTGVELDHDAAEQAGENAEQFNGRVKIVEGAIQEFCPQDTEYQLIVSNPPYFSNSLQGPNSKRNAARHNDTLKLRELMSCVDRLLASEGLFSLILPAESETELMAEAEHVGLYVQRICRVKTTERKPVSRLLVEFGRDKGQSQDTELIINGLSGGLTAEHKELIKVVRGEL